LGYQMPLLLNIVGIIVEQEQYIDPAIVNMSPMETGGWGSDFVKLSFGPFASFKFSENMSLLALVEMKTGRRYTDATIGARYFKNRSYESTYVYFDRFAVSYDIKF
ncbi:MAG: hypothetical protein JW969_16400, partial [Spirochaetales bacterium]|nr:hypothetical protein [Spirochaetales bacterium]